MDELIVNCPCCFIMWSEVKDGDWNLFLSLLVCISQLHLLHPSFPPSSPFRFSSRLSSVNAAMPSRPSLGNPYSYPCPWPVHSYSFTHCTANMHVEKAIGRVHDPTQFHYFIPLHFVSLTIVSVSSFAILPFSYSTCSCFHSRSLVSFQMRLWLTLFLSALIAIVMADYTMVEEQVDIDYW